MEPIKLNSILGLFENPIERKTLEIHISENLKSAPLHVHMQDINNVSKAGPDNH